MALPLWGPVRALAAYLLLLLLARKGCPHGPQCGVLAGWGMGP